LYFFLNQVFDETVGYAKLIMIFLVSYTAGRKIFGALDETIKFYRFNYSNIVLFAFFFAKDLFIIKVL